MVCTWRAARSSGRPATDAPSHTVCTGASPAYSPIALATSSGVPNRKYDIGPASGPLVRSRSGSTGRGTGCPVPSTMYLR